MNRVILTGSVIVGIAVMMSISMIAPAFAASPWKDLWSCTNDDSSIPTGTEEYVNGQGDCGKSDPMLQFCTTPANSDGHFVFFDKDGDNIRITGDKIRCVKD